MRQFKIAHISKENRFLINTYYQFSKVFYNECTYFVHKRNSLTKVDYLKKIHNLIVINETKQDISDLYNELQMYDIVIFHGLDMFSSQLLLFGDFTPKVVLFFFGGEIYENPKIINTLPYGKLTKKEYFKLSNTIPRLRNRLLYNIKYKLNTLHSLIKKALTKIDYFGVIHEEDYQFVIDNNIINPETIFFKYSYYPIEFLYNSETLLNGNNILIGNSRSFSNNHLEAFELLKQFKLSNRKIIIPFSYGNITNYKEIISKGKYYFGSSFYPIFDFLPLNEYNSILSSCSIAIMNHYRQQAVGNIIALIYSGTKVYLSNKNTFLHYLKRINCVIYSIEDDLIIDNKDAIKPLNKEQIKHNHKILYDELGEKKLLSLLKSQILDILESK